MTGIYFRVERNGKWENIELENLTSEERKLSLERFDREALIRTINILCEYFNELSS